MKHRGWILGIGMFLLLFCLVACQVKRPNTVLTDKQMEDVLYDYHIAKALTENVSYGDSYKQVLIMESVYRKHGITSEEFDSSMVWFARYPDVLAKIYEKVTARLKAEKESIAGLVALRDNKPKESLPGDSVDVWIERQIHLLTQMPMSNKLIFAVPSDTNFKARDTLRWNVQYRFFGKQPDSTNAPLMALHIFYERYDTLLTAVQRLYGAGLKTLTLSADTLGAIKEIRGSIYYPPSAFSTGTLLLDSISLMRYHATDSLFTASVDTLLMDEPKELKREDEKVKSLELKELVPDKELPQARPERRPRPMKRDNSVQ